MDKELEKDPITMETFTDPVLASDGVTYDFSTLLEVVKSDPLKLSPMTREPLRNVVFVNNYTRDLIGLPRIYPMFRELFPKMEYQHVMKTMFKFNPKELVKDPVIMLLLQKLNLWDKILLLKLYLNREDGDTWSIFGPPSIIEIKDRLIQFMSALKLDKVYKNVDRIGTNFLYVYNPKTKRTFKFATLENIFGSLTADECFDE